MLIEVHDSGPGKPELRAAGLDEEDGRGLFLVQAYATAWGWQPAGEGKTVWARCTR